MKNELTVKENLSADKVELIKRTICKGATNDELELFVGVCNRTQLDPFARQIYAVKRYDSKEKKEVMSVQVSIDGQRLVAERSGKYAGQVGPFWHDGKEWHDVWLSNSYPLAAKVGILRHDFKEPLWAVARFEAYAQTTRDGNLTFMWSKMPEIMIAKCAESLALRKAFPHDLSGLYSPEEMGTDTNAHEVVYPEQPQTVLDHETNKEVPEKSAPKLNAFANSKSAFAELIIAAKEMNWDVEKHLRVYMKERFGKEVSKDLTPEELKEFLHTVKNNSFDHAMKLLIK